MEVLNVPTEAPVSELSKTALLAHIISPIEQNRIGGGDRGRNDSEVEEERCR
jgi:hypothetical protein